MMNEKPSRRGWLGAMLGGLFALVVPGGKPAPSAKPPLTRMDRASGGEFYSSTVFDAEGNVISTSYSYDATEGHFRHVDAPECSSIIVYDAAGRVCKVIDGHPGPGKS